MTAPSQTKANKTGLLLMAGALFALTCMPAQAGFAQSAYENRLNQLENQVQTLSRSVYRGAPAPAGAASSGTSSAALGAYEDRLSALEQQQRELLGKLEKANYDNAQLKDRLDKMSADYEMRFSQLNGTTPPPAPAAAAANAGGPVAATPDMPATEGALDPTEAATQGVLGTLAQGGGGGDPAETLYESAFTDVRESKYDSAERKLKTFMSKYSTHPLAANAQYWLSETYYVRGDYRQAAKMFAQGYQDYPQGQKAADSLLKLGLSLSKLGKTEDACLSLQQLQKEFPGDSSPVNRRGQQEIKALGCK